MALAHPRIEAWFDFVPGTKLNPDLAFGLQCVDTIDHYGQYLFGVPWQQCVGAVPNGAKQLWDVMPSKYWIKVRNEPGNVSQMPPRGSVGIFDGFAGNPYGHTLVFENPRAYDFDAMQQDGFAPPLQFVNGAWYSNKPCHRATYRYPGLSGGFPGRLIGWCIPRENLIVGKPTVKTTMDGIDVSSWQAGIQQANVKAEFVIVKATGGASYTNPHFKAQLADARKDTAHVGVYHFMRDGGGSTTAKQEADYFLKQTKGQIDDKTLVVLDFEHGSLLNAAGISMAVDWIQRVKAALGKAHIVVYANLSVANMDWSKLHAIGQNKLWLAQYPAGTATQGYGPKIKRGTPKGWQIILWQYTQYGRLPGYTGNLDLNLFYGNATDWNLYAAPAKATPGGGLGSDTKKPAPAIGEDVMPNSKWNKGKRNELKKGEWKTLYFDPAYTTVTIGTGTSMPRGIHMAHLAVSGLEPGEKIAVRFVIDDYTKGKPTKRYRSHREQSIIASKDGGTINARDSISQEINVPKGSNYRIRLEAYAYKDGVVVEDFGVDSYTWK